jgi:hypothetical protein
LVNTGTQGSDEAPYLGAKYVLKGRKGSEQCACGLGYQFLPGREGSEDTDLV